MPAAKKVQVVIADGRVVYVDGHAFSAGATVTVTAAEAEAMIASGDARKA